MTIKNLAVTVAALTIGLGSSSMAAPQTGERHQNRRSDTAERPRDDSSSRSRDSGGRVERDRSPSDRGGGSAERRASRDRQSQDQGRQRGQVQAQEQQPGREPQQAERNGAQQRQPIDRERQPRERAARVDRNRDSVNRESGRNPESARGDGDRSRRHDGRNDGRNDNRDARGSRNSNSYDRGDNRGYNGRSYERNDRRGYSSDGYRGDWSRGYNGYSRGYYAPRPIRRAYSPRRYYDSGGRLSIYFGLGSGYRYGSRYDGRVYGYRGAVPTYGSYVSYGDLRLRDFPRDGAVYVDGYYAGVVDDFDGFLQRLTLEVGPHEIEVQVRGGESQFFDVYVDPYNTIDLHSNRWR